MSEQLRILRGTTVRRRDGKRWYGVVLATDYRYTGHRWGMGHKIATAKVLLLASSKGKPSKRRNVNWIDKRLLEVCDLPPGIDCHIAPYAPPWERYRKGDRVRVLRTEHGWYDGRLAGVIQSTSPLVVRDDDGGEHFIQYERDIYRSEG